MTLTELKLPSDLIVLRSHTMYSSSLSYQISLKNLVTQFITNSKPFPGIMPMAGGPPGGPPGGGRRDARYIGAGGGEPRPRVHTGGRNRKMCKELRFLSFPDPPRQHHHHRSHPHSPELNHHSM
eukprot:sb/3475787/